MEWRGVWRVHVTCGVCRVACGVACGVGRDNVMHQALGSYSVSNIKCIETTKQWKYAANTIAAGALALDSCMHCPELQYIS